MSQQTGITKVIQRIAREFSSVRADMGGQKMVKLTMSEYNALAVKDPNTLYFLISEE